MKTLHIRVYMYLFNIFFVLAMLVLSFSLINRHLLQCIASVYCNMYIMCVINVATYQYQIYRLF